MTTVDYRQYEKMGFVLIPYLDSKGTIYQIDAWQANGRLLAAQIAEEIGEELGFIDPRMERLDYGGHRITEGFTGELCDHQWGMTGHFGRNPYGTFSTCVKCGVHIRIERRRRSEKVAYIYDVWKLRGPVFGVWTKRGPVPGSLQPQDHHFPKGGAQ